MTSKVAEYEAVHAEQRKLAASLLPEHGIERVEGWRCRCGAAWYVGDAHAIPGSNGWHIVHVLDAKSAEGSATQHLGHCLDDAAAASS